MRELVGKTKYKDENGNISEALVYFNGVGNNMTFEENGNVHLISSKERSIDSAKITFDYYIKNKVIVN